MAAKSKARTYAWEKRGSTSRILTTVSENYELRVQVTLKVGVFDVMDG